MRFIEIISEKDFAGFSVEILDLTCLLFLYKIIIPIFINDM